MCIFNVHACRPPVLTCISRCYNNFPVIRKSQGAWPQLVRSISPTGQSSDFNFVSPLPLFLPFLFITNAVARLGPPFVKSFPKKLSRSLKRLKQYSRLSILVGRLSRILHGVSQNSQFRVLQDSTFCMSGSFLRCFRGRFTSRCDRHFLLNTQTSPFPCIGLGLDLSVLNSVGLGSRQEAARSRL